jgi:hypothetical protein
MEDKNWNSKLGRDFKDSDYGEEFGISQSDWGQDGFNRKMLDLTHQMNVEGYMSEGISETKAKHMADQRRSMAMKAAKAAGLTL